MLNCIEWNPDEGYNRNSESTGDKIQRNARIHRNSKQRFQDGLLTVGERN